jgi:uncharacterized repeat protein (TIGR02543 family)
MESQAFDGCSNLETITIKSPNVTLSERSIAIYALKAIYIPCNSTTDFSVNTNSVKYETDLSGVIVRNEHTLIQTEDENWKCEVCGEYFNSERVVISTTGTHVDNNNDYICDICEKQIARNVVLNSITADGKTSSIADLSGGGKINVGATTQLVAEIKNGYTFEGWYDDSDNLISKNVKFSYTVAEGDTDINLIAIYKTNSKMSVTINGGGLAYSISINGGTYKSYYSEQMLNYPVGTVISLRTNDSDFAYWRNDSNSVLGRNNTYKFTVTAETRVTAVSNKVAEGNSIVSFISAYDKILSRAEMSDTEDLDIPDAPYSLGADFVGWTVDVGADSYTIDYGSGSVIEVASGSTLTVSSDNLKDIIDGLIGSYRTITLKATYKNIEKNIVVTSVINGETTETDYNINDIVTLTAEETSSDGMKFAYWKDSNDKIVSYNTTYKFYATEDETYTAVYIDSEETVEATYTADIISITKDTTNNQISFVSMNTVPTDCVIVKSGVIATSSSSVANGTFDDTTADYVRAVECSAYACRYTWTKSKVTSDQTWYVRAYLIYKDANGNTNTVYGDVVSATLSEN